MSDPPLRPDALTCPVCGIRMDSIVSSHIRSHGFPDSQTFKSHFGLKLLKAQSICDEHAQRMRERNPRKGNPHSPEALEKMSKNRTGKGIGVAGKYERTEEIRDKISEGLKTFFKDNPQAKPIKYPGSGSKCAHTFYKRGWIQTGKGPPEVYVRSSWEERVVRILDLHPCIEWFKTEPFKIPYLFEGITHQYTPDFLVRTEGLILEVWEVKPASQVIEPINQAKFKALNEYALLNGMNARIVVEEDIVRMERQVGIKKWKGPGEPWVKPKDPEYRSPLYEDFLRYYGEVPE